MLNATLNSLYEIAKKDKRIVFIGTDNSPGLLGKMQEEMPERYFMEGCWEQNIVGLASGLAADGFIPYILNHATFATRRAYEQIMLDSCLQDRPIRIIGSGAGLATAHLGPTHTAIEDVALMRLIPKMSILSPGDANEASELLKLTPDWPGSLYIRLAKYGNPDINTSGQIKIGKAVIVRKAKDNFKKIVFACHGAMTNRVISASEGLYALGFESTVLHFHTIKPLDENTLIEECKGAEYLFVVEEHIESGGLGTACFESILKYIHPKKIPIMHKIALLDLFVQNYGTQDALMERFGLDIKGILSKVIKIIN
jgi:transketolase